MAIVHMSGHKSPEGFLEPFDLVPANYDGLLAPDNNGDTLEPLATPHSRAVGYTGPARVPGHPVG